MAFLIGSAIGEMGALAASIAAEIGLGDVVSAAIGGAVVSNVSGVVNEKATEKVRNTIGEENLDYLDTVKNELLGVAGGYLTGNFDDFISNEIIHRQGSESPRAMSDDSTPNIQGYDVSTFIIKHATELANNGVQEHIIDIIGTDLGIIQQKETKEISNEILKSDNGEYDPKKLTMAQRLSNYYADKSLSKSPEFKEIFDVYDGSGISPENVVMSSDDEFWKFDIYDETGNRVHLEQNKKAYVLPAVYGVFGGAMSPNNYISTDVPDTCFLCHDADYGVSYFHWKSDMKLVSRLIQQRDKWPEGSISQLNSIVIYFATLGASLAVLKGSLVGDGTELEDTKDDIFDTMIPEAIALEPEEYFKQKREFYKSFNDGIEEAIIAESPLGTNTPVQLRRKLNKIKLEIL